MHGFPHHLRRRGRGLIRPAGPARVDFAHPLVNGLDYLRAFDRLYDQPLFISKGWDGVIIANANPGIALGPGGPTAGSIVKSNSNTTYKIPQTAGSLFIYVSTTRSQTGGTNNWLFSPNSGNKFGFQRFTDNKWYVGWQQASDTRVSANVSGSYVQGVPFVIGVTWDSGGTRLYCNGVLLATNVSAPSTGDVSGEGWKIGSDGALNTPWIGTVGSDCIYWFGVWNRALRAAEVAQLNSDPWGMLTFTQDRLHAMMSPATVPAAALCRQTAVTVCCG
jgi:hypothetical protein